MMDFGYQAVLAAVSNVYSLLYMAECNRMGMVDDEEYRKFLWDIEDSLGRMTNVFDITNAVVLEKRHGPNRQKEPGSPALPAIRLVSSLRLSRAAG